METLGKYEQLERIGRGAMGVVYRGVDPWLGRTVAVKVMSADFEADDELLGRFQREAQVAVQLKHPNIIEVYDGGIEQGRAYIAMEFLDGEDLKQILAAGEVLPLERLIRLIRQVCDALSYAHGKGVVHRDIKPGNIQVTASGDAKILDFGLARITDSEMTATGMVMGTPNYMAPEQVEGEKVDERADIFAVGSVFYEMLTGKKAFEAENMAAVLFAVTTRDPTPVHEVDPDLPEELSAVIGRALEKDPEDRYGKIQELDDALGEIEDLVAERKATLRERATGWMEELDRLRSEHADGLELIARARAEDAGDDAEADIPASVARILDTEAGEPPDDYVGLARLCRTLGPAVEEARELLARLGLASALLDEAAELEQSGRPEEALENAARVVADFPWHPRARALERRLAERLEEQRAETRRREHADEMAESAQEHREQGDLEGALDRLASALSLVPDHERALELRDDIRSELQEAQERERRARQAADSLDEARAALGTGKLGDARTAVLDALQVDPEVEGGQELLQQVENAEAEEERRRLREEALEEARRLAAADDLQAAATRAREALELDPDSPEARRLRDDLQSRIDARERQRHLEQMLNEARSLAEVEPETARDKAREILQEDPDHVAARELLQHVEAGIARRQAEAEERAREQRERQARAAEEAEARPREPVQVDADTLELDAEAADAEAADVGGPDVDATTVLDASDLAEADADERPEEPGADVVRDDEPARPSPAGTAAGLAATVATTLERAGTSIVAGSRSAWRVVSTRSSSLWHSLAELAGSARALALEHPRWIAAGVAVLALTLAVVMFLGTGPEGGPATSGTLLLDASPWARVVEVRNASTGEPWPLESADAGDGLFTPVRLSLGAGRWEVTLEQGSERRSIQVDIEPGDLQQRRVQMRAVDVDRFLGTTVR